MSEAQSAPPEADIEQTGGGGGACFRAKVELRSRVEAPPAVEDHARPELQAQRERGLGTVSLEAPGELDRSSPEDVGRSREGEDVVVHRQAQGSPLPSGHELEAPGRLARSQVVLVADALVADAP
ncbi:MAG TPA: hypothetical protein PK280_19150, partial [Planctomycetota bacterium]|nr:hypothetical protein [Planctomycetota bacterium]